MYSEGEFFHQIPVIFDFLLFEYNKIKYGELNTIEYFFFVVEFLLFEYGRIEYNKLNIV